MKKAARTCHGVGRIRFKIAQSTFRFSNEKEEKGASHQIWVMWRSSFRSLPIFGGWHLF